uniref:AlNc14C110G6344 protein n=1 Tax=Albugo laibachii Nc14 TaxID=890382 RepID=F0WIE4_9STRA|nr:AlNc14C110G6344 [Albugo laibachii Nc14]|eukprot:CCA21025.1 AlNc14C110G6344 [Albugo laibachii Nc14]
MSRSPYDSGHGRIILIIFRGIFDRNPKKLKTLLFHLYYFVLLSCSASKTHLVGSISRRLCFAIFYKLLEAVFHLPTIPLFSTIRKCCFVMVSDQCLVKEKLNLFFIYGPCELPSRVVSTSLVASFQHTFPRCLHTREISLRNSINCGAVNVLLSTRTNHIRAYIMLKCRGKIRHLSCLLEMVSTTVVEPRLHGSLYLHRSLFANVLKQKTIWGIRRTCNVNQVLILLRPGAINWLPFPHQPGAAGGFSGGLGLITCCFVMAPDQCLVKKKRNVFFVYGPCYLPSLVVSTERKSALLLFSHKRRTWLLMVILLVRLRFLSDPYGAIARCIYENAMHSRARFTKS